MEPFGTLVWFSSSVFPEEELKALWARDLQIMLPSAKFSLRRRLQMNMSTFVIFYNQCRGIILIQSMGNLAVSCER